MAVIVEEGLRGLNKHFQGWEWYVKRRCMEERAGRLQRSGYPSTFGQQLTKASVHKWDKICNDVDGWLMLVHRARE